MTARLRNGNAGPALAASLVLVLSLAACGSSAGKAGPATSARSVPTATTKRSVTTTSAATTSTMSLVSTTSTAPARPASSTPTTGSPPAPTGSLRGKVVAIDPGHDGGNENAPATVNALVPAGGFEKPCDTTGTETDDGYPEHAFTFDVATRLAAILRAQGATVVMTRSNDTGVGPCVNVRAQIGNDAHADAAVSIHADGGPTGGRGVQILEPAGAAGAVQTIVAPSAVLGADLRAAFSSGTGTGPSTYLGQNGIMLRSDLGGLNLSTVPKAFVECGNMRNAQDATLLESPAFRQKAAQAVATGLTAFLTASP